MTDETEDARDAEPLVLGDGDCMLADGPEFYELTKSVAAKFIDGCLYVLERDTLKWVDVETIIKPAAKVRAIRGSTDGAK
ncbi:hypothetical protein ISN76_13015 [Dyella halodurans]|uniref:Uncharacterized protein n=1 Tax=Dyella halodurans TaxID=1920171 RepID=A0ABV9C0Z7_9GAMM|nr:hypothetical protein [Dyella halodurans]